jgi:hypothetical protein
MYLEALIDLPSIFAKGISHVIHDGSHHYYMCLLHLENLRFMNMLPDMAAIPDRQYKQYLADAGKVVEAPALEAIEDGPVMPPVARVERPRVPRVLDLTANTSWVFVCGDRNVSIRLDGFSHASARRRAYSQCPFHNECYKYATLLAFTEPWQAVASILIYMRAGAVALDKREHRLQPAVALADLESVRHEMPEYLFQPGLELEL